MEKYDYRKAVENDVREYLEERGVSTRLGESELDAMYDEMMLSDSVTGNGSGSYTFNAWTAEENLCHNLDLLHEVMGSGSVKWDAPEGNDVMIRCYLLRGVLEDVNNSLPEGDEGDEDDED